MNIPIWLPALACVSLLVYMLVQRRLAPADKPPDQLARLVGTRRQWGESDASLRRRSIALSRWPFRQEAAEFVWWARLWKSMWRPRSH